MKTFRQLTEHSIPKTEIKHRRLNRITPVNSLDKKKDKLKFLSLREIHKEMGLL